MLMLFSCSLGTKIIITILHLVCHLQLEAEGVEGEAAMAIPQITMAMKIIMMITMAMTIMTTVVAMKILTTAMMMAML